MKTFKEYLESRDPQMAEAWYHNAAAAAALGAAALGGGMLTQKASTPAKPATPKTQADYRSHMQPNEQGIQAGANIVDESGKTYVSGFAQIMGKTHRDLDIAKKRAEMAAYRNLMKSRNVSQTDLMGTHVEEKVNDGIVMIRIAVPNNQKQKPIIYQSRDPKGL